MTKKINKAEIEREIQIKYSHIQQAKTYFRISSSLLVIAILLCIWGFLKINDPVFANVSDSLRNVIAWVSFIIAICTTLTTLFLFSGIRNAKKSVLALIDLLDKQNTKR